MRSSAPLILLLAACSASGPSLSARRYSSATDEANALRREKLEVESRLQVARHRQDTHGFRSSAFPEADESEITALEGRRTSLDERLRSLEAGTAAGRAAPTSTRAEP